MAVSSQNVLADNTISSQPARAGNDALIGGKNGPSAGRMVATAKLIHGANQRPIGPWQARTVENVFSAFSRVTLPPPMLRSWSKLGDSWILDSKLSSITWKIS
jgi:hypothetical protein